MRDFKIISGGQTGADRAALDVALELGIPHGGWCPRGRLSEDGPIDPVYHLQETQSQAYRVRTKANVEEADLTILFSHGPLTGGSLLTQQFAEEVGKPCLHIDFNDENNEPLDRDRILQILEETGSGAEPVVLNIAGPRASTDPEIYDAVYAALKSLCG